jgi:ribosomal-protein-alanine acetyltransferase
VTPESNEERAVAQAAGVNVRVATADDLDAVMAIERPVFGHEAWSEEMMRRDMADANCYYLVGELVGTGQIVGYAGLLCAPGSGEGDIQTIAVSPLARGRGLARVMMVDLIAEAAHRGANRLFLEVRSDNPIAIGLYRNLDFREVGVRAGYYQPDNVDAVVMRLEPVPGGPASRSLGPIGSELTNPPTVGEWPKDGAC